MKTKEALMISNFLNDIAKDCTGKLGYAIARNMRLLNTELTEYNDRRNELIKKHGTEKDGQIVIENGSEAYFSFVNEMKEYEDIDVDVNFMKVSEDELINSKLSANEMAALMEFMIEEKSE